MSPARRFLLCCLPAAMALASPPAAAPSAPRAGGPSIALRSHDGKHTIEVDGLDPADLRRLAEVDWDERRWSALLSVFVGGPEAGRPAILGSYRVEGGVLRFEPRFPFVPGLGHLATFRPDRLPGREGAGEARAVELSFALPKPPPAPPTALQRIYPSRSTLPENQLKFYLHFSAPMSQGGVYDYIHLLDADGREIEGAFLKIDEELWDRDGRRLTLLVDPGRIKRDVGPREGLGPVLEAGKAYTLLVDSRWPDAEGRPLRASSRKSFRTTDADVVRPDLKTWRVQPPVEGSNDPLVVESPEPLDHALFGRLVSVQGPDGSDVPGVVAVDAEETRWTFTPDVPWLAGRYQLLVDAALEDLAGNNLQRPFELDVFDPVARRIEARVFTLPFEARPRP